MERKWKALILVDGYNGGVAHITADQIRDHNIAMYGNGDWVLPVGNKLAYEIVNNNTINLSDGMIMMNGARAVIGYGQTETLTIENGTSGYKRADIIVAEYNKDNETLVESVTVKVVKGTLGSAYSDPALVRNDIRAGATKRQMALYRVKVNGLSIEAVEKMWTAAVATLGANIVPIAKGGTGATTAANALKALGGASIKKVWPNASPSSLFPPQDVTIAANEGDLIGIEFESQTGATDRRITWLTVKAGMTTELVTVQSTSDGGSIFVTRRAVTITNANSINFDKGYYRYVGDTNKRHDGYSIPTAVYIAKGVS